MSSISLTTSSTDYQLANAQTTHRADKTLPTPSLRINTNNTDDVAELVNDSGKSAAKDLNEQIGPAYIVELSSKSAEKQTSTLSESESAIPDANVIAAAANLVKVPTVQQSGVAALAQSNAAPQSLISLVKG